MRNEMDEKREKREKDERDIKRKTSQTIKTILKISISYGHFLTCGEGLAKTVTDFFRYHALEVCSNVCCFYYNA